MLLCLLLGAAFQSVGAQTVVDLSEIDVCGTCRLALEAVVRLGADEDPGMIEEEWTRAAWGGEMGYLTFAGATIKRFDADGRFAGQIGRSGDGPGEFRAVTDVHVVGGQIVAFDYGNRSWSQFDESGTFVRRQRYPGEVGRGRFHVVGHDTVIVAGMDRRDPDVVGYPLHLTTLAEDAPIVHFGADSPYYVPNEPYASLVVLGTASRPGTVWWGKPGRPHWEEWSVNRDHLRTVVGNLPWFPRDVPVRRRDPRPIVRMGYFGLDGRNRFWILTEVPDPGWEQIEFVLTDQGWEPTREARPGELRDARLDVFDLAARRHLGHYTWDGVYPALMLLDGELAVSSVEVGADYVPRLAVYRLADGPATGSGGASP